MKKAFSFAVIFLIIILTYQFIVIFFEKNYDFEYQIESNDYVFTIREQYRKNEAIDGYFLNIKSNSSHDFIYYVDNNYNKQKKIINEIETFVKGDYLCIYPKLVNASDVLEIECSDGNNTYSYDYVSRIVNINDFPKNLGIINNFENKVTNNVSDNSGSVVFYKDNISKNEHIGVYFYQYLEVFADGKVTKYGISDNDVYDNSLSVYINNYFLFPVLNDVRRYDFYRVVDVKKGEAYNLNIEGGMAKNIYNLGVINDKLYVFDLGDKKEYEIEPNGKMRVIGTVEEGFVKYVEGKWVDASILDFVDNRITFKEKNELSAQDYDFLYQDDKYYFYIENNKMYKTLKNNTNIRMLLFDTTGYKNFRVSNGKVYFLKEDCLYRYDEYGIKIVARYNEFKYNNNNMYGVYVD